jgi:hypothetical protein
VFDDMICIVSSILSYWLVCVGYHEMHLGVIP